MFTAYLVVTVMAAIANAFSAALDFVRYRKILIAMDKAGVPQSWLTTLGVLKAAGALGLLVGVVAPPIGIAAAVGLILFFVAAIITHLRVRDNSFGLAAVFLSLAVAALVLRLASSWAGWDPGFGGTAGPRPIIDAIVLTTALVAYVLERLRSSRRGEWLSAHGTGQGTSASVRES